MIRTTPFHARTSSPQPDGAVEPLGGAPGREPLPGLGQVRVLRRPQRGGIFDSSPLFKYRITGRDAERFLAGILARDIRACPPGHAQYTTWLDERGFVLEDGVVQRRGPNEYLLTAAEPNYAYFADRIGRLAVTVEEVSLDLGTIAVQGPRSRDLLARLLSVATVPFFGLRPAEHRRRPSHRHADRVHRRPRLRDLGRHQDALPCGTRCGMRWRATASCPYGLAALYMLRIEAGLLLWAGLRLESIRLQRRPSVHPDRARLVVDVQGPGRRRSGLHRAPGARARAGGADLALEDDRAGGGLGGLRPGVRRGRPDPAEAARAAPRGLDGLRRRRQAGGLCHQRHVLAGPPAPHRVGARPPGPRQGRYSRPARVHGRPPLPEGRRARRAAAPLQPASGRQPDEHATTPSSSVVGTTASSTAPTSPAAG